MTDWQPQDLDSAVPPPPRGLRLSVVIPAFNDLAAVLACLNTLQALQAGAVEYVVQDDNSPNTFFPMLIPAAVAQTYRNAANLGFAGNCNEGAKHAHGDVLLLCNQDIQAAPGWSNGWDAALLAAFADPQVGAVGARLLFPDGSVQSAGGIIDALKQPYHRCLGYSNPHMPEVSTPADVTWATGAALAIRADLFRQLGGFDTAYARGYWEDVDLCMRVREAGYRVFYEPRCTLFHSVGSTGGSPHFLKNALLWKSRWVDTGKVKPDVSWAHVRYW